MSDEDIVRLIRAGLASALPNREAEFESISIETRLAGLGVDSVDFMDCIGYVEDELRSTLPPAEIAKARDLRDLAVIIRGALRPALT